MLAISAATAITAPASAAPIIIRDTVTSPIFETGVPHDCRDLTGTIVGTDVVSFQSVETDQGFHIEGTTEDTARIDWSDGSFALVHSVDHFSFNVVGHDTTVFTEAHTDSGDFFTAAGVFEFSNTFREINHFTITDGVLRVDLQKGHFLLRRLLSRDTPGKCPNQSRVIRNTRLGNAQLVRERACRPHGAVTSRGFRAALLVAASRLQGRSSLRPGLARHARGSPRR